MKQLTALSALCGLLILLFACSEDSKESTATRKHHVANENATLQVDATYADDEWSGTVRDRDGKPISGASIIVIGTTDGTITDSNGAFKVKAIESRDLNISFIGYQTTRLEGKKK